MPHFNPRRIFRRARLTTLRAYFADRGMPIDVAWDDPKLNGHQVAAAWDRLEDADNARVAAEFHDFATMSEEAGVRALLEACRMLGGEWALVLAASDPLDAVMRAAIEREEAWALAVRLAETDQCATGRSHQRYDGLPAFAVDCSTETCARLRDGLASFYRQREGRGQYGVVEAVTRAGGIVLFTAYLSDYQLAREILTDRHELQRAVDTGRVFTVVISCPLAGGIVDISTGGGRRVRDEILTIFGRSMAAPIELTADPFAASGCYELNHLRQRRALAFDPGLIADARIRAVRFRVIGRGRHTVEVKADPHGPLSIYDVLDHWFDRQHVPPTNIDLQSVTFAVRLVENGGRQPCFSFTVTRSGSNTVRNLKERYRHLGEQLIATWRLCAPQPADGTAGAGVPA